MKQALWFLEHANPEVSLILFHYSYSQYKYRNIFKETNDIQIILTYFIVVDLLHNPNNQEYHQDRAFEWFDENIVPLIG